MNKPLLALAVICALSFSVISIGVAAPADYQVTGPITAITDTTITVQKGKETWEIAKDATVKPKDGGELRVGDKVEVHYTMSAKTIERKDAPKKTKPPTDTKKATATPAATAAPTAAPSATPAAKS